ncbi:M20 family metallo-hydrolase [Streptosporangium sp. DT93]|uniref:M20 family metallo-hydrolase n=1 Tax=Streptosporangium sp. DT93 TaxID=3393428 RepID=UPI003CF6E1DE
MIPDIDPRRLLGHIEAFARIGGGADGGVTREGFGEADLEACARLRGEARLAGLEASVDAAGNLLIRRPGRGRDAGDGSGRESAASSDSGRERDAGGGPGRERDAENRPGRENAVSSGSGEGTAPGSRPVLLIGSHLDTVVNGGRLDGAYGVLAGLEVMRTIVESGAEPAYEPVLVAFANEEGALFPQPFWGSKVLAGALETLPGDPRDHTGRSLRGPLARAGGDLSALSTAVWPAGSVAAYLELHVEQGPVLERGRETIGVVDSITGRTQFTVEVRGSAGHAGTTPMELRRDPVAAAARIVLAAEEIARERRLCRVATVGWVEVQPNSPNTIAGGVRLTVDLRDSDPRNLENAEEALRVSLASLAKQGGVDIDVRVDARAAPVHTDPAIRAAIEASAGELGLAHRTLPSGAGHDAQIVARIAPIGMIFVPSVGGLSHVPEEDTGPADLVAGARVLLRTVLRL